MIKLIIIDDEPMVSELIARTIESYCPNVTIAAVAESVKSGVSSINEHNPDLIILDVKMPDGSGFDLLKHFDKPDFKVIFISGYMEYAIKGYKFGAIDYILKPIDAEELSLAINRADDLIRVEEKMQFKALEANIKALNKSDKIILKTSEHVHLVNTTDIIRIEADGNYSTFYIEDGRKVIVCVAIKEWEGMLIDRGFHRIHKSHIININKLSYFDKTDSGDVIMSDSSVVPVSFRKREMLLNLFNSLT
ncbi:MAG: LytTR family DNA-binding domain-containing protein [Bacteroidetes bacterium]|nr:LytTR family DNA-binding domain-containing protein [Bacteroidota bacterium]